MLIAACIGIGEERDFHFSVSFSVSFSIWGIVHSNFSPFLEPPPAVDLHPPPSRFPISVLFEKPSPPPTRRQERERESEHEQAATGSHDAGGDGRERQHHSRGTYLGARDRPRARRAEAGDTHARTRRRCLRTWSRRDQVEREGLRWRGALGGKGATGWPSFLFSGRSHLVLFQPPVPLPCPNVALRWP